MTSGGSRADAIRRAAGVWAGQLVDLTARNNLLYYRDLKLGTLDLSSTDAGRLHNLFAGKQVSLSALYRDEEALKGAAKRARTIRNRAEEHFEERGLETLYLACGMATWTNQRGTATPCAPVLLCPVRLAPKGSSQDDFELSVTAELEVNLTLLQYLSTEYGITCDPDELLESSGIEGAIDTPEELDYTYHWLAKQYVSVPGFSVNRRFVLGTFSYAKLPMVQDLEGAQEAMVAHDLIAALAGDPEAQAIVRDRKSNVAASAPDYTPPADEYLVLDADSSQNYVINSAVSGQDIVIKGPPGNGKSQTITNLISTLVARGKTVLFVAEKRAAIDAVLRRLNECDLGTLVLDLHGKAASKRSIAQALGSALEASGRVASVNLDSENRVLESRREELKRHVTALHSKRDPWDVSYFDAQSTLMGLHTSISSSARLRGAILDRLDREAFHSVIEDIRDYGRMGGFNLVASGSPWLRATITSRDEASRVVELLEHVSRDTIPQVTESLNRAAESTGLVQPDNVAGWESRLEAWATAGSTLASFEAGVYSYPIAELVVALRPLVGGIFTRVMASIFSAEYRKGRATLREMLLPEVTLTPKALYEKLEDVAREQEAWGQLKSRDGRPSRPEELAHLTDSFGQLMGEIIELEKCLVSRDS